MFGRRDRPCKAQTSSLHMSILNCDPYKSTVHGGNGVTNFSKCMLIYYECMRILDHSDVASLLGLLRFLRHTKVHPRSFCEMIEVPWGVYGSTMSIWVVNWKDIINTYPVLVGIHTSSCESFFMKDTILETLLIDTTILCDFNHQCLTWLPGL